MPSAIPCRHFLALIISVLASPPSLETDAVLTPATPGHHVNTFSWIVSTNYLDFEHLLFKKLICLYT